jgi:hypothetical protein
MLVDAPRGRPLWRYTVLRRGSEILSCAHAARRVRAIVLTLNRIDANELVVTVDRRQ